MLWQNERESDNVIDQRRIGAKGLGLGGLILGAVVYYLMGGNPLVYLAENAGSVAQPAAPVSAQDDSRKHFAAVILGSTEEVWSREFSRREKSYVNPSLVLFRDQVRSACGTAASAMGPFYCPGDQRVYLDLGFFDQLQRLGAKGDLARAYVIAHEVGHHVQNLLGLDGGRARTANQASVKVELQADCFAGMWAKQSNYLRHDLQPGDFESALSAAAAVGDDRLQARARGEVIPDSFTHGSSAQRQEAFTAGFTRGEANDCLRL